MSHATPRTGAPQDEFFVESPIVHSFVGEVQRMLATHFAPGQPVDETAIDAALDELQPLFADLLADQQWLPDAFAQPDADSGMGGGIATWLLFRAGDRSLSLFSLVVPPGAETPVHDHLAWGFVGLYRGEQEERVYQHDGHPHLEDEAGHVALAVAEVNQLKPGDFYKLIPPDGDIHSVKTTSAGPSVSIHLLANDTGCVVRHAFDLADATVRAFRSGYANVACEPAEADAAD